MSISRASYVVCDGCGNPGPVECMSGAEGAREQARQERWTRVKGRDLCPTCSGHNHWTGVCVPGVCPAAESAPAVHQGPRGMPGDCQACGDVLCPDHRPAPMDRSG